MFTITRIMQIINIFLAHTLFLHFAYRLENRDVHSR